MLKKELRRSIRQRLKELKAEDLTAASNVIQEKFLDTEEYKRAETLFVYINMPKEPATDRILARAWADGKKVYVPKCFGDHIMKPVLIRSMADLAPGMMDIPEPVDCSICAEPGGIDLAAVPCMAASGSGKRLGHGAGYYDYFFEHYDISTEADAGERIDITANAGAKNDTSPGMERKMIKICLCFAEFLTEDIPMEENDVWMDRVITEE